MTKKLVSGLLFLALVVGIVLYASGTFDGARVEPGTVAAPDGLTPPERTTRAEVSEVEIYEDAVGTIESRTTVTVSSQITARVLAVHAEAGARVQAKATIVVLDDRELAARRAQAEEGLLQSKAVHDRSEQAKASAAAVLDQATKRRDRVKALLDRKAATPEQMEVAEGAYLQATAGLAEAEAAIAAAAAGVQRGEQVLAEAQVAYGHTTIRAPIDGVVSLKAVEPGDLAWPGKVLLEVLDPTELRLEAQVREGLLASVEPGEGYVVRIPAIDRHLEGTVAEVCPTADPRSRTFRVRLDLDPTPGLHPGMFGRLRLPLGKRAVVRVPRGAVHRTGQLASVQVQTEAGWQRRMVTTGLDLGDGTLEVLSGLEGGETVGLSRGE